MQKAEYFLSKKPIGKLTIPVKRGNFETPVPPKREGGIHKIWVAVLHGRDEQQHELIREWVPREREYYDGERTPRRFKASALRVGDVVEFGHDVLGGGPKGGKTTKAEHRWYGVVRGVTPRSIEIDRYDDYFNAFVACPRGESLAAGTSQLGDLSKEREELEQRISAAQLRLREVKALQFIDGLYACAEADL